LEDGGRREGEPQTSLTQKPSATVKARGNDGKRKIHPNIYMYNGKKEKTTE